MCRLLGVVTRTPQPLADGLGELTAAFTELGREHRDGWGIAAWSGQEAGPRIVKDTEPAAASPLWDAALTGTRSDAALLHLRLAGPGLPVVPGNTHPFTAGALAFAHNGYISPYDALDDLIDADLLAGAGGGTDSERYFLRAGAVRARRRGPRLRGQPAPGPRLLPAALPDGTGPGGRRLQRCPAAGGGVERAAVPPGAGDPAVQPAGFCAPGGARRGRCRRLPPPGAQPRRGRVTTGADMERPTRSVQTALPTPSRVSFSARSSAVRMLRPTRTWYGRWSRARRRPT